MLNRGWAILSLPIMRVLAVDASLRNTGVAIVDANNGKPRSIYFGTIHNASSLRSSSCLVAIRDRLVELIREHEPDCCALESVIYVQSHKTAILLGAARGAAILAAAENGLPVFEYSPRRIKQSTVGRGAAEKDQVAFMVRALLGLTETPAADAADALAIGLTHLRSLEVASLGTRLHDWADSGSIELVRQRTDSPWRTGRRAFAASSFRHQSRRPGHLSRPRAANGLSDYRSAPMRSGFTQIFALARTIAH